MPPHPKETANIMKMEKTPEPTLLGAMEETGSLPDDLETPIGIEWDSDNETSEL